MTVTYSTKHIGLGTGLAGALLGPNKWVTAGMVVFGWAWDNAATVIDRRMKRKGKKNAD